MWPFYDRPIFTVDRESFAGGDLLVFAISSGRWDALERATREAVACMASLARAPRDAALEREVDAEATLFREQRDLLSGEEMEAWLAARGVTPEEWTDAIRRRVLRRLWADQLPALVRAFPASPGQIAEAIGVDCSCAGAEDELARMLATRAAAARALLELESAAEDVPGGGEAAAGDLGSDASPFGSVLPPLPPDRVAAIRARLARLDWALGRLGERAATPDAIRREVELRRLDWVRLECRAMHFESESAAREAAFCVREDGQDLEEVARRAHRPTAEVVWYFDQLSPDLGHALMAAAPGETVGPVRSERGWSLFTLMGKRLPTEQDPALQQLGAEAARARAVRQAVERWVRWI